MYISFRSIESFIFIGQESQMQGLAHAWGGKIQNSTPTWTGMGPWTGHGSFVSSPWRNVTSSWDRTPPRTLPLSNKGRVLLPNNSCLHSSMFILRHKSFALTRTFFSILTLSLASNGSCRLRTSHGPSFQPAYITYHIHTLFTSNLKIEAAHASKNLVSTNKNAWYHNAEQYCLWISRFTMLQICKHPSLSTSQ